MNLTDYEISQSLPSPEEFCHLRAAAGLSPRRLDAATIGLSHSIVGICIRKNNQLVGMARLIGDGGTAFEVVDVAVLPSEQGQGLGKLLMKNMMAYVNQNVAKDASVTLIADVPADQLYAKFGFHKTAPKSIGMAWKREN